MDGVVIVLWGGMSAGAALTETREHDDWEEAHVVP